MTRSLGMIPLLVLVLLAGTAWAALPDDPRDMGGVNWIWTLEPEVDQPFHQYFTPYWATPGVRYFMKDFELPNATLTEANLTVAGDNIARVYVNGQVVGDTPLARGGNIEDYRIDIARRPLEPVVFDVKPLLKVGRNNISIEAASGVPPGSGTAVPMEQLPFAERPGPAGLIGRLGVRFANGTTFELKTDTDWLASRTQPSAGNAQWEEPVRLGPLGISPWRLFEHSTLRPPDTWPEFIAPGLDEEMAALRELHVRHFRYGSAPAYRDRWMPRSYNWPAINPAGSYSRNIECWDATMSNRIFSLAGYVSTEQQSGFGHPGGWPFPFWWQAGAPVAFNTQNPVPDNWPVPGNAEAGMRGWHFSIVGTSNSVYLDRAHEALKNVPTRDLGGWTAHNAELLDIGDPHGLRVRLTGPGAWIQPPPFEVGWDWAPFLTLEWDLGPGGTENEPWVAWASREQPGFSGDRMVHFPHDAEDWGPRHDRRDTVSLHEHPGYRGLLTHYRIGFGNAAPGEATVRAVYMTQDTRHNVNNANFIAGVHDQFATSGDMDFLRRNFERARVALDYALREFEVEEHGAVWTPWIGHDGRSGLVYRDGRPFQVRNRGIGNNYWDLIPWGGFDATATMYLLHAIDLMADMEEAAARYPAWGIAESDIARTPEELRALATRIRREAPEKFWNPDTGRFGACRDIDGILHDYGFTFVNNEAIYYGLAPADKAREILAWTTGERIVDGDTSQGDDIYVFRFAPRATTLRNEDYYGYYWMGFLRHPFGNQVQDGGAVFGLSYHDLMARLEVLGPENAWERLDEIIEWYKDVQAEGGYREYFPWEKDPGEIRWTEGIMARDGEPRPHHSEDPSRRVMQSPRPGGLGIDREFGEPILVAQFLLSGFAGFEPKMDGFAVNPRLPSVMPELAITRVRTQGVAMDLEVSADRIVVTGRDGERTGVRVYLPDGGWRLDGGGAPDGDNAVAIDLRPGASYTFVRG